MHMHIWYAAMGWNASFSFKLPCGLIGLLIYNFHCFNHISNWYQIKSRFCVLCRPARKCSQRRRFLRASRCCCCCCARRCRGAVAHHHLHSHWQRPLISLHPQQWRERKSWSSSEGSVTPGASYICTELHYVCVWSQSKIDKRKLCGYTVNPPAAEIGVMK